jgi:hypothetical protein
MTPSLLLSHCKGLPFIHDGFDPGVLATFVSKLRRQIDGGSSTDLFRYLDPAVATEIYRKHVADCPVPLDHRQLCGKQQVQLGSAIGRIIERLPHWKPLFSLPVEWRKLINDQISSTNPMIPQHIFLGTQAFSSDQVLEETVVHEMSHTWCSMIAEVRDFQEHDAPHDLVLPSRTSNKSVRGVLLAALFSAAALRLYVREEKSAPNIAARTETLIRYLEGCLDTLQSCRGVSETGQLITRALRGFAQDYRHYFDGSNYANYSYS